FSDEKSGSYKINIDYPQVDFGPDALMGARGNAQDINNSLDSIVNSIKDEFVKQVSELPEMKDLDAESEMAINGVGWINNNHLICTQLINYTYIKGTAHPMTTNTTFNYTIDGEGPLGFSSLFRNDKEYLNYISTICIRDLETKLNDEDDNLSDMITDGASADMKNFSNWSVENDTLIIIFNPYQVAPYVYGMQSVGIPLNELMEYIDPKGPLEYMFR
nr:RsiV family protein [Ignavibacteria bacterium]